MTARRRESPASRSYDIRGAATQLLPFGLRSRANVNYFSSIQQSQAFNTNIYDASRNSRSFGGNVVGAWGKYSLNATMDHTEYFYNLTDSVPVRQLAARVAVAQRAADP